MERTALDQMIYAKPSAETLAQQNRLRETGGSLLEILQLGCKEHGWNLVELDEYKETTVLVFDDGTRFPSEATIDLHRGVSP